MKMTEEMLSKHMQPITGSAIRDIFKLLAKPGMISFAGAIPPIRLWSRMWFRKWPKAC